MSLAAAARQEKKEALAVQKCCRARARELDVARLAHQALARGHVYRFDGLEITYFNHRLIIEVDGRKVFHRDGKNIVGFIDGEWVDALRDLAAARAINTSFKC